MNKKIVSVLVVTAIVFNALAFMPQQMSGKYSLMSDTAKAVELSSVTLKKPKIKLLDKTSFSVRLNITNADNSVDYQVRVISNNCEIKTKKAYYHDGDLLVIGLSANKKYSISIRSSITDTSGKRHYSAYSKALTVKTKKAQTLKTTKTKAAVGSSQVKMTQVKTYSKAQAKNCARLVNSLRKDKGLGELKWDDTLYKVALERAKETTKSYRHERPDGSSCFTISSAYDGENIVPRNNVYLAHLAWCNSPAHYDNMVYPGFTRIAVAGVYYNGNYYFVEAFGY